jgi:hypothetical protein
MSKTKKASEAGLKAEDTKRRRGKPPSFDTNTLEGRVKRHAYKAASAAIGRAKAKGKDESWFDEEWMLQAHLEIDKQEYLCAVSGIRFDVDNCKTKGAGGTHLAPSPDRIDPENGYVRGNVRWVLWAVNRAKGEMPEDLFVKICCEVAKRHDPKD